MIDRHIALAAAGFIISGEHRYSLQQRGLPGAVFADNDGDGAIEAQLEIIPKKRQAERIGVTVGNARRVEPHLPEVRRGHVDGPIAF